MSKKFKRRAAAVAVAGLTILGAASVKKSIDNRENNSNKVETQQEEVMAEYQESAYDSIRNEYYDRYEELSQGEYDEDFQLFAKRGTIYVIGEDNEVVPIKICNLQLFEVEYNGKTIKYLGYSNDYTYDVINRMSYKGAKLISMYPFICLDIAYDLYLNYKNKIEDNSITFNPIDIENCNNLVNSWDGEYNNELIEAKMINENRRK